MPIRRQTAIALVGTAAIGEATGVISIRSSPNPTAQLKTRSTLRIAPLRVEPFLVFVYLASSH